MQYSDSEPPNNNTCLLTIAIPHYQDFEGLRLSVKSLAKEKLCGTEILICDNATPGFEGIIAELRQLIPRIKIFSNPTNIGFDRNLDLVVRKSSGKFVWLLGCDDTPVEGSLAELLKILSNHEDAINVSLSVVTDKNMTVIDTDRKMRLLSRKDEELHVEDLFNSALSGNVINKNIWMSVSNKNLEFENWCHVERIFQMHDVAGIGKQSIRLDSAHVQVRRPAKGWWNIDDGQFLFNVIMYKKILEHYIYKLGINQAKNTSVIQPIDLAIIRSIVHSRAVHQQADPQLHARIRILLAEDRVMLFLYKALNLIPKPPIRHLITVARAIKSFA
jgi:glycosyltransferase involved in cell wall biosynthesis